MIKLPTLSELKAAIIGSLESELGVKIPDIGKNFLRSLSNTVSGQFKLFYLVIGNVQKNIFVDTADPEAIGGTLERFGRVKLGRNPFLPRAGQYELLVTGEIGAIIPATTTFKSDDTSLNPGFLFILDEAFVLESESDTIIVRALTAGLESKLNALDTLTATAPIALVDSLATVYNEFVEPLAGETTEEYRAKTLESYRLEVQGGSDADYRLWAQDAQGVRFVYPFAKPGVVNGVNIFTEAVLSNSIDGKGTPSAALLDELEAILNFDPDETLVLGERGRRPTQVILDVQAISVKEVDIIINGYVGLDATIEAALLSALTALINDIRPFVAGADIISNKNDILDINKIIATILSQTPGAVFTSVTLKVDGISVSTFTFTDGNIPFTNSVSFA